MAARELVVLGTAAQAPTRRRNHNGYFLRWDDEGVLFDPGEGTQRQLLLADVPASRISAICITHAHGDHCLGLPGVLQRLALDGVAHPVNLCYPAAATPHIDALENASASAEKAQTRRHPVERFDGPVLSTARFSLLARPLDHRIPTVGWRVQEPNSRRMLPERLAAAGVSGPDVGRLQREGALVVDGRVVRLDEVSAPRPGQAVAFVMDTRRCEAAVELAAGVDLLICESTYLAADAQLAADYAHLTATQAALIAREAGARQLVLTHLSRRYGDDPAPFAAEAAAVFPDVVVVKDLDRVPLPPRRG